MLIQISTSNAANAVNDNVLAGNQFEFAARRAIVSIGLNQSAVGLEIDVLVGMRAVVTRLIPLIKATSPIVPDDFSVRFGVQPGERIIVRARNTTGGALTLLTTAMFQPV